MSSSDSVRAQSEQDKILEWFVVYAVEGLLILTGNLLTMAIFWRRRRVLRRASYLLINLATADSLVGCSTLLFAATVILRHKTSLTSGPPPSAFAQINLVCMSASILSLACIALERLLAFARPLVHRAANTRYYYYTAGVVWLTAGMICALALVSEKFFGFGKLLGTYSSIVVYGISLVVICVSYILIWRTLSNRPARDVIQRKQNRKIALTLSLLTLASLLTFIPGEISLIINQLSSGRTMSPSFSAAAWMLVYSNSFVNPFVYVLNMQTFRRELLLLLRCKRNNEAMRSERMPLQTGTRPTLPRGTGETRERVCAEMQDLGSNQ